MILPKLAVEKSESCVQRKQSLRRLLHRAIYMYLQEALAIHFQLNSNLSCLNGAMVATDRNFLAPYPTL